MPSDPEALYVHLGRLLAEMPDLPKAPMPLTTIQWLARAGAILASAGYTNAATKVDEKTKDLMNTGAPNIRASRAQEIAFILYRELAEAEFRAPLPTQGAFIPAGNAVDALVAMEKVLKSAIRDILIVDPYMDAKALTDFAPFVPEQAVLRLLADDFYKKATLAPAARAWVTQFGTSRSIEVRLAQARTLHDRLIIADDTIVWVLTQSLNAFATRAPASIVRVDPETTILKIAAYQAIWAAAVPL